MGIFIPNPICYKCEKIEDNSDYFFHIKGSEGEYKNKILCYNCLEKLFVSKYGYKQIPYLEMSR